MVEINADYLDISDEFTGLFRLVHYKTFSPYCFFKNKFSKSELSAYLSKLVKSEILTKHTKFRYSFNVLSNSGKYISIIQIRFFLVGLEFVPYISYAKLAFKLRNRFKLKSDVVKIILNDLCFENFLEISYEFSKPVYR